MPVSTRPFHDGNTENDGFYTDEHGIYPYIHGKTPVHVGVITERAISAGPYTVDSRTATDVRGCPQMNKIFLGCVDIRGHTVTGRVPSGINPCTIRTQPCSSIENSRTRMVPVFIRSLRWLHGTSRFIHGTNMVDFRPGRSGRKIEHV